MSNSTRSKPPGFMQNICTWLYSPTRITQFIASELMARLYALLLVAMLLLSAACSSGMPTSTSTPYATQAHLSTRHVPTPPITPSAKSSPQASYELFQKEQSLNRPANNLPSATQAIPFQPISPSGTPLPHPDQTSDLVYIASGNLMRWDYVTGFSGALIGGVSEFSASANGKKIALLRPKKIAANGVELFDLALLDFESMQVTNILEQMPRLYHITISPDGGYIAYTLDQQSGPIYVLPTGNSAKPRELGKCYLTEGTSCQELVWSPDSKQLLWSDAQGIWESAPDQAVPHLVHSGKLEVSDPQGKTSAIDVHLLALTWSPIGRFVLLTVTPIASEVSWRAVLDTRTGRLVEVPDSFETQSINANVSWSPDGELLSVRITSATEPAPPAINIWQVLATHDGLLIHSQTMDLDTDNFSLATRQNEDDGALCLNWLTARELGALMLAATLPETDIPPVLLQLNLVDGNLDKLIEIPFQPSAVLWSPDGAGALIIDTDNQVFFAHPGSGMLYNLSLVMGKDAHNFTWLPPAPRS
jgi:WD40 repeat protein